MRQQNADSQLIGRMQSGDGTAVTDLASKNWEDAEEVTQDVLMKVYRKIDAFRGDAALSSWIYRITFNTAMSRLRSTRVSRMTEIQKPELASQEPERTPAEPADWSSLLPAVYRVPVILRDIQGLSTEEASAVLKVKPQTLKSRLHRGRLMLREHLADFADGVMLHARESEGSGGLKWEM